MLLALWLQPAVVRSSGDTALLSSACKCEIAVVLPHPHGFESSIFFLFFIAVYPDVFCTNFVTRRSFISATFLGFAPGSFGFVYFGSAGKVP